MFSFMHEEMTSDVQKASFEWMDVCRKRIYISSNHMCMPIVRKYVIVMQNIFHKLYVTLILNI